MGLFKRGGNNMKFYFTMINWIDPNGNGIISEYIFKSDCLEGADKKAVKNFWRDCKKMYGTVDDIEIKKRYTTKIITGLHNQRKWRNPV